MSEDENEVRARFGLPADTVEIATFPEPVVPSATPPAVAQPYVRHNYPQRIQQTEQLNERIGALESKFTDAVEGLDNQEKKEIRSKCIETLLEIMKNAKTDGSRLNAVGKLMQIAGLAKTMANKKNQFGEQETEILFAGSSNGSEN